MTFGQNPSFGSRNMVQTSFLFKVKKNQSADVTLKMTSKTPNSNHFIPSSQKIECVCANSVKIRSLVQVIECIQEASGRWRDPHQRQYFPLHFNWWDVMTGFCTQLLVYRTHTNLNLFMVFSYKLWRKLSTNCVVQILFSGNLYVYVTMFCLRFFMYWLTFDLRPFVWA